MRFQPSHHTSVQLAAACHAGINRTCCPGSRLRLVARLADAAGGGLGGGLRLICCLVTRLADLRHVTRND